MERPAEVPVGEPKVLLVEETAVSSGGQQGVQRLGLFKGQCAKASSGEGGLHGVALCLGTNGGMGEGVGWTVLLKF